MKKRIGIDIGGTKVAFGLLDEKGNLVYESQIPSVTTTSEDMFNTVVTALSKLLADNSLSEAEVVLGVGVPGIVDIINGIAIFQTNLPWDNFPLKDKLKKSFPNISHINIDNDVFQAARAEWDAWQLNVKESMVFLTVSTGVSSPVIIGGNPVKGSGVAGELGLFPVWHSQRLLRLEEVASGSAIAKSGQFRYKDTQITTKDVFDRYRQKDQIALEIIDSATYSLAQAIYVISCLIDPTKIILGGSVIMKNSFMLELLKSKLDELAIPVQKHILDALVLSKYDNNAGLIGAALSAESEDMPNNNQGIF